MLYQLIMSGLTSFFLMIYFNYLPHTYPQKLIFHINGKCYHIHHWIIGSYLISFGLLIRYIPHFWFNIIIAVLVGFIVEDFLFRNEFTIIVPC